MAAPPPKQNTETGHQGGNAKPTFPPFDATTFPSQILWFAIAFGALYILMARIGLPRVAGVLDMRRKRIAQDLDEAAAMQKEAREAGAAYDKTLADAKAQAHELAAETRAKLKAETDGKRHTLEAELNTKLASAEAQINDMKAKAMANVGAIARDATAAIIEHLTGRPADPDAVNAAVAATDT